MITISHLFRGRFVAAHVLLILFFVAASRCFAAVPQSIEWTGTTREILHLGQPALLGAIASSGLPVTIRISGPATMQDGAMTAHALGTIAVTAEQTGDATYLPARKTRLFNVRQVNSTLAGSLEIGTVSLSLKVVGNYAYSSEQDVGLAIFDVSDPARPRRVGSYDTPGNPGYLDVIGNHVFLIDSISGLLVIDVAAPENPVLVGRYAAANGMPLVVGTTVYLANSAAGLVIIDVANPVNPVFVGSYDTPGLAIAVSVSGRYAYVADFYSMLVIDISNPAQPLRVGEVAIPQALSIQVAGKYAYVASDVSWGPGLHVIDISNPAQPLAVGEAGESSGSVQVLGNYAFLTGEGDPAIFDVSNPRQPLAVDHSSLLRYTSALYVTSNHAYAMTADIGDGSRGLGIFDLAYRYPQTIDFNRADESILTPGVPYPLTAVANSDLPVTIRVESGPATIENGTITITGPYPITVVAEHAGNDLYLPARASRRFNVRTILEFYEWDNHSDSPQLAGAKDGDLYYLLDGGGLRILDIQNPLNPTQIGMLAMTTWAGAPGRNDLAPDGELVFVSGNGLHIVNVRNPSLPTLACHYEARQIFVSVAVSGQLAAAARIGIWNWPGGDGEWQDVVDEVDLLDVQNPASPRRVGRYQPGGAISSVTISGQHLFVAGSLGLDVVDITDPAAPQRLARYQAEARDFLLSGNLGFLVDGGLQILDLSTPTNPRLIGRFDDQTGGATSVSVSGNFAWLAGYPRLGDSEVYLGGLVQVVDISDLANPTSTGTGIPTVNYGQRVVHVTADYVYAHARNRISIAELSILWPQLSIRQTQDHLIITWESNGGAFQLQQSEAGEFPGTWQSVQSDHVLEGRVYSVRIEKPDRNLSFRLYQSLPRAIGQL